ncbi:hypothetical protein [Erythrobacter aureus]|uniref:hypothetical protein n=1 Tax=Erythrobacter aureus TaxID=2182384 RepID=UPI003A90B410
MLDPARYRQRNLAECFVNKLKHFRRRPVAHKIEGISPRELALASLLVSEDGALSCCRYRRAERNLSRALISTSRVRAS